MPSHLEEDMLKQYQKERADYEEKQLQKLAETKAQKASSSATAEGGNTNLISSTAAVVGGATTPTSVGGATRGKVSPYEDPADAVKGAVVIPVKPVGEKLAATTMTVGASTPQEAYTPVFNTLPDGKVEFVSHQGKVTTKPDIITSGAGSRSYENSPAHTETGSSGQKEVVTTKPTASENSPGHTGTGSNAFKRGQDSLRRSNKRTAAKEVVEFKDKKFRVANNKREDLVDGPPGGKGAPQYENSNINNSGGDVSPSNKENKPGGIVGAEGTFYAMVNISDKRKNRCDSDVTKKEGSGIPQHYKVAVES